MAATGATPISLYYSSTTTNVPTAGNLVAGELALNTADGKLFYKDSSNVVQVIGTKGGVGTSSTTQVLYNSSGLVVGSANLTFNGTTLTTANDASISGLTVGKGGGAVSTNTALGLNALLNNSTGSAVTAIGYQAGYTGTTAYQNSILGFQAAYNLTTGYNNSFFGFQAGGSLATGNGGIYLGFQSGSSSTSVTNEIVIGSGATGKGANTGYIYPNAGGVYQGNNSTLWSITSDQRLKKNIVDNTDGLNKITAIQVRNFEYRTANEVTELEPQNAINIQGVQLGAIAQELQVILPDCVKTESTGVMSVDASNLTWYLINAVKELNAKVTALEAQLSKP